MCFAGRRPFREPEGVETVRAAESAATGGPDRSIRKNNVPSGSGPSGLHYRRNGFLPSGVERNGPSCPVFPRPARFPAGRAWQTDRRGESADFPANRRRRTCRASTTAGSGQVDFAGRVRSGRTSAGPGTGAVLSPAGVGGKYPNPRNRAIKQRVCEGAAHTDRADRPARGGVRSGPCSRKIALPGLSPAPVAGVRWCSRRRAVS